MDIEFRDLALQKQNGGFGFDEFETGFSLGFWNHQNAVGQTRTDVTNSVAHYGYVHSGHGELQFNQMRFEVCTGMYFCVPGKFSLSGEFSGVLMSNDSTESFKKRGIFQLGGPVEDQGRLQYIDGCSDTLLIAPPRLGLPCVNLLKIPPQTLQRFHTHPSFRFGMITEGRGTCDSDDGSTALTPGTVFYIPPEGRHRFRTDDSSLTVIAFHPDSDFGPDDSNHPMVNKTIVDGVSAAKLSLQERQIRSEEYRENSKS